jgi:hypothetical protein
VKQESELWAIKTHHNTFVSAGNGGNINTKNGIGISERFLIAAVSPENPDPMEEYLDIDIAFKTHDGKFIHAGDHFGNVNTENGVGSRESFFLKRQGGGLFAIQMTHDTFLRAGKYGDINHVNYVGDWEKFKFIKLENGYAIKTAHGTYIRSHRNNVNQQNYLGPQEVFQIVNGINTNMRQRKRRFLL